MSMSQEHDYIGLSEALSTSDKILSPSCSAEKSSLNLRETELRLGLPGSESPDRRLGAGVSLGTNGFCHKGFVSGAKRGFSDAINSGSGKWGLGMNGGSEVDLGKEGLLFSPRGGCKNNNSNGNSNNNSSSSLPGNSVKEIAPPVEEKKKNEILNIASPALKAGVVGWPPVRSFRKNTLATSLPKSNDLSGKSGSSCLYVKVSMDGAPYLRKIDLKTFRSYAELSSALEKMFSCFTIGQYGQGLAGEERLSDSHLKDLLHSSEYVLTYEDKDGDWMLVGDVPWEMFTDSCKRLRIMKGSDVIGLAPRTMEKRKNHN